MKKAFLNCSFLKVNTSYMFIAVQVNAIGGERMKLSTLSTLDAQDVCDETVSVPATEYHVLVKTGL